MVEANKIDWKLFESQYWSPEKGKPYEVVLANWRMERRSYDDEKTEKPVLVFDVLKVDLTEYALGEKLFVTGALSFATPVKPIILAAEARGETAINLYVEFGKDKQYKVIDLKKVRGLTKPSKEAN